MEPVTTEVASIETTICGFDSMVMEITSESPSGLLCYMNVREHLVFSYLRKEVFEKVVEAFLTLSKCYHLYGMRQPEYSNAYKKRYYSKLNNAILRCLFYLSKEGYNKWIDYLKYITLNFYAFHETENTDLIPRLKGIEIDHQPQILFGGVFVRFLFFLKKREPTKFKSFILTINQAKMGLPRPTPDMVAAKEYETAIFLTSPPRPLPEPELLVVKKEGRLDTVILDKELICKELQRTVREVFKDQIFTSKEQYEPFCPSTNANYTNGRAKMGAVLSVIDVLEDEDLVVDETLIKYQIVSDQLCYTSLTIEKSDFRGKDDCLLENALPLPKEAKIDTILYDDVDLRDRWRTAMLAIHRKAKSEIPLVEPVGLSEALKVRVISKGPPYLYTYLKPFQKFMHRVLRHHKTFQLVGKPVTEEIINSIFPQFVDPKMIFLNGDYKASTDNLRGWVSETLATELSSLLIENRKEGDDSYTIDLELLIRSLTQHIFVFRDDDKIITHQLPQRDGQLMGSISSFPFLCLANAALCRLSMELTSGRKYFLHQLPLLVNGDDCTMVGHRGEESFFQPFVGLRDIWTKITNYAGLTSSQGKTIFSLPHKPMIVINSMTFDWNGDKFLERKYVPLGIMMNKPRSGITGIANERNYYALGSLHRELHRMTPEFIWPVVSENFISNVKPILSQCPNIPWYTPEYLGGPGLLPKGEVPFHDRKLFTTMIMYYSRFDLNSSFRPSKNRTPSEWKFNDHVRKSYDELGIKETNFVKTIDGGEEVDMDAEAQTLYKLKVVDSLFRCGSDLFIQTDEESKRYYKKQHRRTLRENMNYHTKFQKISESMRSVRVREWEDIVYKRIEGDYPVIGSADLRSENEKNSMMEWLNSQYSPEQIPFAVDQVHQ